MLVKAGLRSHFNHILISMGIGLAVGNISLLFLLSEYIGLVSVIKSLVYSSLIGIGIGYAARISFNFTADKFRERIILAYIVEGILVFLITILVTYVLGQRELIYLLVAGLVALVLAMCVTYFKFKEFKELNSKLKEFQNN